VEFRIGERVVYPSQGVSVVERIAEEEFGGTKVRCYHLRLLSTDSRVVVPVGNSARVGLRPLAERAVIDRILRRLETGNAGRQTDWKDRYRANLDRIKTGTLDEIVDVLLSLSAVAARKTLSFRERKMYDHARQLLAVEVAEVQGRSADEVVHEVDEALALVSGTPAAVAQE
jgi:CarD family transcriptional regulator